MITPRTANAELAVKLLTLGYGYSKEVKLTEKQAADLLIWIKEVDYFLRDSKGNE
jgi:hypothetical protein